MPEMRIGDLNKLVFPKGVRQQYATMTWHEERKHFLLMIITGCFLFLLGALL